MINEQKTKDLKMNEIFEEIKRDMDDFFTEMDKAIGRTPEKNDEPTTELVHEVDGKIVCEPLEDVLRRDAK
jgi:DNA-binding ferritin-like protein